MFLRFTLIFVILSSIFVYAQNSQKSEAYKKYGLSRKTPLFKPKYPSYNLAATFVLKEKAKKGDPFAQHELGLRYILGIGVPLDTIKASYWIGQAASKNLPAANFNYGIMLHSGIGVEWNPFLAYYNFKVAAESGMAQGQYILGLMYTDNLIVSKNLKEAQKWLTKSANKDFEEAKKVLDEYKKQGLLVYEDSTRNDNLGTRKVAASNNFTSIVANEYELDFYNFAEDSLTDSEEREMLNNILEVKYKDLKKLLKVKEIVDSSSLQDTSAISIINFAALTGSPEALLIKARFFEHGIGVGRNLIEAAANYLKAFRLGSFKAAESLLKISQRKLFYNILKEQIDKNNANAMYVWAGLIALGMDYSLTEEQAFDLLLKAKKQEHINSIIELGLAYYSGSLVEKDSVAAIENFKYASDLGSSEAEVRLAYIDVQSNKNGSENIAKLIKFSGEGSVLAEAALANCYEKGICVKRNKGKAASLYRQAAQRGNEAAYNSLRNMYDELRPDEEVFQIYVE